MIKNCRWQTRADLSRYAGYLSNEKANLLCPAGIGDLYWIMCKMHAHAHESKFWFPDSESHRAGYLGDMLGIDYGYLPGLTTDFVWGQHGEPRFKKKEALVVQANRHLEEGKRIEDWYKGLPLEYPKLKTDSKWAKPGDYIAIFTCSEDYMGGQLHPTIWATIIRCIMQTTGYQIVLIGSGSDVNFCRRIEDVYSSTGIHSVYNQDFKEALHWIFNAKLFIGVASGFTIMSTCHQINTLTCYPRHLKNQPGTFEPPNARGDWCFLDTLPNMVFNDGLEPLIIGEEE